MSQPAWYRSLYWRIGLIFVVFLIVIVSVEAGALVWLTSKADYGPVSPATTFVMADELGRAIAADPKTDIARFFKDHYEERVPLVVVMRDGRVVSSNGSTPSEELLADARARLEGFSTFFEYRRGGRGGEPPRTFGYRAGPVEPGDRGGDFFMGPGPRSMRVERMGRGPMSPIPVNGEVVGVIVANPQTVWQQFGPTLLGIGFALIALGTTSAAFVVFGPVRRRLRSLEDAARKVGRGDLTAHAREDGGDEVAELAHAFNQMTSDLGVRAEQLQASDRERRALLADVSHELMTPLTAMRGYLETLGMSGISIDEDTRKRYLSIIGDETQRMEHIVGDLVDLARLEGTRESLDWQDVPVEGLFGRVQSRHEREAQQKQVALTSVIEPGAEIVSGDPLRLEQALQNLAANALRHTPPGGRIELRAGAHDGEITLAVRDTGIGIPAEHLPHVFDRFYKADPSRAGSRSGSGLGLSIVKAIVGRHGGTITATSTPGQGTEFFIRLPERHT